MTNQSELEKRVQDLREDFATLGDGPFKHFYCPILLKDEDVELCMGHVVNEAIPNTCRKTVPQRKDIDGFYGSLLESHFSTAVIANRPTLEDVLFNPVLRKKIPVTINVAGKPVDFYEDRGDSAPHHPELRVEGKDGQFLNLAIKISDEELSSAGSLHFEINRDYVPDATASLLKAAHLTMFTLFGYRHVFSPAGMMVAEILRTFFEENRTKPRKQQAAAARDYFLEHAGMVLPLLSFDRNLVKGSIEDHRFLVCTGTSSFWFAIGVFVRTNNLMNVVFLPPDNAENMDTYCQLIKDMHRKEFRYQFLNYFPGVNSKRAHCEVAAKVYTFQPGSADAA